MRQPSALLAFGIFALFTPPAHAAPPAAAPPRSHAPRPSITSIDGVSVLHAAAPAAPSALARAVVDTFRLYGGPGSAEGRFEGPGGIPDLQGWTTVDLTESERHWQVSTYQAANLGDHGEGNRAFWCGRDVDQVSGWATPPGYGNRWNDAIEYRSAPLADPGSAQVVGLDFYFNQDTEPGYDHFLVEYDSAGTWKRVYRESGYTRPDHASTVNPPPGARFAERSEPIAYDAGGYSSDDRIHIRMVFQSDGAWSDEDGLWPTEGAVQLDDIVLTTSQGTFTEDFEDDGPYLFVPVRAPFAGDFAKVYARLTDIDPCRENTSPVVAFIDTGAPPNNAPNPDGIYSTGGSLSPNWNYGTPGGWVLSYTGGLSFGTLELDNEIRSPIIPWDLPGPDDDAPEYVGAVLKYDTFFHLPLTNAFFVTWRVRSRGPDLQWSPWRDRNFVYYGGGVPQWTTSTHEVGDLLVPDVQDVQIALGVADYSGVFFFPNNDATPSPYFDNVSFSKARIGGPLITALTSNLANDGFPRSGSSDATTSLARDALDIAFDMARDVDLSGAAIDTGDSIVVTASALIPGSTLVDLRMKWTLRKNPTFEDALRSAPTRDVDEMVDVSDPEVWSGEVVASQSTNSAGTLINDTYFFDLPDVDFLYPGDQLQYYVQATDDAGRVSTLPADVDGFAQWDANGESSYPRQFTVRGLPTFTIGVVPPNVSQVLQPSILVVDDTTAPGGEPLLRTMFAQLGYVDGVHYDSYRVPATTSQLSNGIGSAGGHGASATQLAGYDAILYFAGRNGFVVLSDGSDTAGNDKSDDLGVLGAWRQLPGRRSAAFFGENFTSSLTAAGAGAASFLSDVLGVGFVDANVGDAVDMQLAPFVVPVPGLGFGPRFAAVQGCRINGDGMDAIVPIGAAVAAHRFLDRQGDAVTSVAASVLHARMEGGWDKLDLCFPFAFASVGQDPESPAPTRATFLSELLAVMGHAVYQIGAPPTPGLASSMSIAPNPFNPRTTIVLSRSTSGRVTVNVYDTRGARVRTLLDRELDAGVHRLQWDGDDDRGRPVASGVYLVRVVGPADASAEKVALIR